MEKALLLTCILLTIAVLVSAQNECSTHNSLRDLAKRSPTYLMDNVPICDRYLVKDWYVAVHHQMPTTAPSIGSCGTLYSIWLQDTLPESQGTTKLVTLCQVGFGSQCSHSYTIRVTNCGTFFVYELIPLDICQSAYCFEKTETCVEGVPLNLAVEYHGVTWNTNTEGLITIHDPEVNLVCKFDRLHDHSLYYDITWYVDDTEVLTNQTVSSNLSALALLTGSQMLAKDKKANSMVHCVVGAKVSATGVPCYTTSSPLFFAGIKVLTPTLRIPRGGHKDVQIQFTIPFVNQHGLVYNNSGHAIVNHQSGLLINMGVHGISASCEDPNKKLCDIKVLPYKREESDKYNTDEWKATHSIRVYNKDDGGYTLIDKHITLRMETGGTSGTGSKIFENIVLPDIQVFIEETDSSWKGAYCESHTDPHMKTFDRKYYECQLDGTFILYRNSHFEQEVQEKHHLCHVRYSYPRCSCAVAVRSGRDVFIVDICNSKSIIHFPSCGDRVLKVIKANDRYYKVILPTGTLVEIKFVSWPSHTDWQLNVDIFPSPSDVGNSSGLCGTLDGDYRNDFTRNDPSGTVDNPNLYHPNEFSESWRVKGNELDLFDHNSYDNLNSISEVLDRVCTCKKHSPNANTGDIECTYGTYKNCKFVVGKPFHCILNPEGQLRRRRDLRHLESMLSNDEIENNPVKRKKRETIPTVKNYEEAEAICYSAFQASASYQTCQEYVTDLSNTSLVNCISDVMITGDDNFTRIHIEAALEQCSVFVVLNITFQQTEPEVTYAIETFCPNNCTGHGICNAGNCTCSEGYAGSDCSFDLLGPPTISHISDFGFCDKSKETCDEITLFGKYFVENMNTNCFMTRDTLKEDGASLSVVDYVVDLEERTLFEGFCPLEYDTDNHWVTIFTFNVSNDGSRFTENFHVYTYQSLCQEYRNETGNITFVFKDEYCFINNTCLADGTTNTNNKCYICNTSRSRHEWSFNEGHCLISGVCYKSGDINGTNPCSICDPSVDTTDWSPDADLCFIDGKCYANGQTKKGNDCHVCKPNIARTNWTIRNDCTSTELNTTTAERTSTSTTATTKKAITTISEPTTTTMENTTSTLEPVYTTMEPSTSTTMDPTTTLTEPTTTITESTLIIPDLSTSKARETTTPEPTTTTSETTDSTTQLTTTILKPTSIKPGSTTTTTEPTVTTTEANITTHAPYNATSTLATTKRYEPSATTQVPIISTRPNCIKGPEDVSVVYHNVSWISRSDNNGTTSRTIHEPYINFKCVFDLHQNISLFYKIEWYVNNVTSIKTFTVSEADVDRTILSSKDLPSLNQTAGIQIHCAVTVFKYSASKNCERSYSPFFFAGIKVNRTNHNILRKGKTAIKLFMTIPYVTKTVVKNGQAQQLPTLAVHPLLFPSTSRCKGSIGLDKCVIEFKAFSFNERHMYDSNEWRQNQTLLMYHVDTEGYEIDQSMTLQLKTRTDDNAFWSNFNQNIWITITDYNGHWKGKSCGSKTDPHLYTFDGVSYENHINGEFILYRNNLYNQEVQTRHKQCHPDYNFPHCTCAVSIQSGQDVFLFDLCGDIEFVDFLSCNDSVIEVYKIGDKLFKVSLPTGTYVMVSLVEWPIQGSWQIDIDIYPSLSDVNNTAGLCGTLDGDQENDFTRRNGSTDNANLVYPDDFSNSWKVLGEESLSMEPLSTRNQISSNLDMICLCTQNGDQCSYNMHCSKTVKKKFLCRESQHQISLSRKKRYLSEELLITSSFQIAKGLTRKRRHVEFNISTSRENAETVCTSAFYSSEPYKICREYVSDLSDSSRSNCINDVIMTGDYNITTIHLEAALQQCVTLVGMNSTLQIANPAITTSLKYLCPSNCSGHGLCKEGNCLCEAGFGGSDCSFDILSPPVIWESTPSGTCDLSRHDCSRADFKGRYFLENFDSNCFITKHSIHHNGSMLALNQQESPLMEDNLFKGWCSLPKDDVTTWVTKYMFNVSYDRKKFTQTFSFYIYQSKCQHHSKENGKDQFTLKEGYCFINGVCMERGGANMENSCESCDPSKNKYDWSAKQDCESTTIKPLDSSASTLVIIVTASVIPSLIVVALLFIIGAWKCKRSKKYSSSSDNDDTAIREVDEGKSWTNFFDDRKSIHIPRSGQRFTQTYSNPNFER